MSETNAACANCAGERPISDMLADERLAQYFCDSGCYNDWADDNFEEIAKFYFNVNISV